MLKKTTAKIMEELADVVFCAVCLANYYDIDLEKELKIKYIDSPVEEISRDW